MPTLCSNRRNIPPRRALAGLVPWLVMALAGLAAPPCPGQVQPSQAPVRLAEPWQIDGILAALDGDPELRELSLTYLPPTDDPRVIKKVVAIMRDPALMVREETWWSTILAAIRISTATGAIADELGPLLNHPDVKMRGAAVMALSGMGSAGAGHLVNLLDDKEMAIRDEVIEILASMRPESAGIARRLADLLDKPNTELRQKALMALVLLR